MTRTGPKRCCTDDCNLETREAVALAISVAREDVANGDYLEAQRSLDLAFAWLRVDAERIARKRASMNYALVTPASGGMHLRQAAASSVPEEANPCDAERVH